ncbi:MAG TPA: serine/threonine protein kinase [Chloroflexi bacterium]|nr:serine/threonine protein kinase [Chloroflexota bacterium]
MSDEHAEIQGDLSGKTLGQYEIIRPLGKGGMATVYLARQASIGRTVAIKVMPAYFMHDPSFLQRFEREVQVIARLQHPRILPVFDYGEIEGRPFIVMAYMSGGTLSDRIKEGKLPLDEIVRLVEQIAEGLDHAHKKGIIHRDFKPSNVLLDENGNAYLADFGIAKVTESTVQLTGSGIVGTPAYMAPEMANQGLVTPAIDIYALGITLYEMLTGEYPYHGDTPLRVMMAHATEPVPDPCEKNPECPPAVAAVVRRAMAKNPEERYATAQEMAAALRAAVEGRAVETVEPTMLEATLMEADEGGEPTLLESAPAEASTLPPTAEAPAARRPAGAPTARRAATPPPHYTSPSVEAQPAPAARPKKRKKFPVALVGIAGAILLLVLCGGGFMLLGGAALLAPPTPTPLPTPTLRPTPTPPPPPTSVPAPVGAELRLENRSGRPVCYVNVSPSTDDTWGPDRLGPSTVIADGEDYLLTGIEPNTYDLRALDCDQNEIASRFGVAINMAGFTWTITSQAAEPGTVSLTVVNDSSYVICYVYISPTTDTTWGASDLPEGLSIRPGQQRSFTIEPGDWDLRAETCDQQTYWERLGNSISGDFEWTLTD